MTTAKSELSIDLGASTKKRGPYKPTPRPTTESMTISQGRQSFTYEEIVRLPESKKLVRLLIKNDSYKFQCFCTAAVFDDEKVEWKNLTQIPYSELVFREGLIYDRKVWVDGFQCPAMVQYFKADRDALLKKVQIFIK